MLQTSHLTSHLTVVSNDLVKYSVTLTILFSLAIQFTTSIGSTEPIQKWPLIDKSITNSKGDIVNWDFGQNGALVIFTNEICPMDQDLKLKIHQTLQTAKNEKLATYLVLTSGETLEKNEGFVMTFKDYTPLKDVKFYLSRQFRVKRTPFVYIFNSNKQTVYSGALENHIDSQLTSDKNMLDIIIKEVSSGKNSKQKTTPVIGCLINPVEDPTEIK